MAFFSIIQKNPYADLYLMENEHLKVFLTNFGAAIFSVQFKNNDSKLTELTLSCNTLKDFVKNPAYFGATVGRTANRIKNGLFSLNGKIYHLPQNDGNNSSHGGNLGFSYRLWETTLAEDSIRFSLHSPDGEEGYPGNMDVTVTYRFDYSGGIEITYTAISDQDTLANFTNHTYWRIGGPDSKIYSQELTIDGKLYLDVDDELVPNGQVLSVRNTPYDFTSAEPIGKHILNLHPNLQRTKGYDVSYIRSNISYGKAAVLCNPANDRRLEVYTNMPIIHVYTGNFLRNFTEINNHEYAPHDAVCLEASYFPDAIHHPHFGQAVLKANELRTDKIVFKIT